MKFITKIRGQHCYCVVTHYRPAEPPRLFGPMEDAEEGIDEEFEFEILDRRGKPAPELKASLTDDEVEQLANEYEATVIEEKYDF